MEELENKYRSKNQMEIQQMEFGGDGRGLPTAGRGSVGLTKCVLHVEANLAA